MPDFDPYHRWLGIPPDEQPAGPHRLLGISPDENDPQVVREAALRQTAFVRKVSMGEHREHAERILGELAGARDRILEENNAVPEYEAIRPSKALNNRKHYSEDSSLEGLAATDVNDLLPPAWSTGSSLEDSSLEGLAATDVNDLLPPAWSTGSSVKSVVADVNEKQQLPINKDKSNTEILTSFMRELRSFVNDHADPIRKALITITLFAAVASLVFIGQFFADTPPQSVAPPFTREQPQQELEPSSWQTSILQPESSAEQVSIDGPTKLLPTEPIAKKEPKTDPPTEPKNSFTELRTLVGHAGHVHWVAFSPDGRTIASASSDRTIKLWNVQTGAKTKNLVGHNSGVTCLAFSPDGKTIASGSQDQTIKLWDSQLGGRDELETLKGHSVFVTDVAFSLDGKTIASGSRDDIITLWDVHGGGELRTHNGHSRNEILSVAFSPDCTTIARASAFGTIKLCDILSGAELITLVGHGGFVKSVCFSPDGKTVASGGGDNTVRLWDVQSGTELKTLTGHNEPVWSVNFSPDGKTIVSGSLDDTVKLWDVQSGTEINTLVGHTGHVHCVAFSPDGKTIASASKDMSIKLWDVSGISNSDAQSKSVMEAEPETQRPWQLELGDDYPAIVEVEGMERVRFSHLGSVPVYLQNSEMWAYESRPKRSLSNGVLRFNVNKTGRVYLIAGWRYQVGPDGKSGDERLTKDELIKQGWELLEHTPWDDESFIFTKVVKKGESYSIRINKYWPPYLLHGSLEVGPQSTLVESSVLGPENYYGHDGAVNTVAFSPDGKRIISGGEDTTIKIWDSETGVELKTREAHEKVLQVGFSPDGKTFFSKTSSSIMFWGSFTGKLLSSIRGPWRSGFCWESDAIARYAGYEIQLLDIQSATKVKTQKIETQTSEVCYNVASSPDGKTIAFGLHKDKTIRLWDSQSGDEARTIPGALPRGVVFSHDGKLIIILAAGAMKLLESETGKEIRTFTSDSSSRISRVAFSPDGRKIIVSESNGSLKLLSSRTGAELQMLNVNSNYTKSIAFSSDSKTIASVNTADEVIFWDSATGAKLSTLMGHTSVAFSRDNKTVASGTKDGTIKLFAISNLTAR